MDEGIILLISILGSLASMGGLLAAALQTLRLKKIKERTEADLWESIRVIREIIAALNAEARDAAIVSTNHLRIHLMKELVLQQHRASSRTLTQWFENRKITDDELDIAKQFIVNDSPSLKDRFGDAIASQLRFNRKPAELLGIINEMGITDAPDKFPSDLISTGISQARNKVRIVTTWIHSMPLELALGEAARNCCVEILLLDPDSIAARQRSKDLEFSDPEDVPRHINGTLSWLKRVLPTSDNSDSSLKVGLYQTAPTFLMYLFDDTLVYCPALHGNKLACSRRQYVVKGESTEIYKVMEEQFLLISKRARFIDLSEWSPDPSAQANRSAAA